MNFKLLANYNYSQHLGNLYSEQMLLNTLPVLPHLRATVTITHSNINNYKYNHFSGENLLKPQWARSEKGGILRHFGIFKGISGMDDGEHIYI